MELIFVHGALVRDGEWWWQKTADLLLERTGIRSRALALPSCGETELDRGATGLVDDAAALRRELDTIESAIVVGHSYGGTVIAEAGQHPAIAHLLYISSYLPDVGQAQGTIMSGESNPVSIGDNGEGGFGLAVELDVHAPALDQATAEQLVAAAHEVCPYSNATRGNIEVTLTIV